MTPIILTITDDADTSRRVQFIITQTAYGIAVDFLNQHGRPVTGAKLDFFDNTLRVVAHACESFGCGEPDVNEVLLEDVTNSSAYRDVIPNFAVLKFLVQLTTPLSDSDAQAVRRAARTGELPTDSEAARNAAIQLFANHGIAAGGTQ